MGLWYDVFMRHLGIDYGTKRIGIALSDEGGTMAFPHKIIENSKSNVSAIFDICKREGVEMIVVGESVNYQGEPNIVKKKVDAFIAELKKNVSIPIVEEREFLTTQQARFFQKDNKRVDDSAAAIILQSYLDKKHNKPILETL